MKIIIFGAGMLSKFYLADILTNSQDEVIGYVDNNRKKQGSELYGIRIFSPEDIRELSFDKIVIANIIHANDIKKQLLSFCIEEDRIIVINEYYNKISNKSYSVRNSWLLDFSESVYTRKIEGDVAEIGVYKGEFSKVLNLVFPDRCLHLFDTFEGFDEKDFKEELINLEVDADFSDTSAECVLAKMPNPNKVILYKGYFPDTYHKSPPHCKFCFVNIDVDLYKPTLAALKIFYPLMNKGGIILIHDYWSVNFPNVKKAVIDFEKDLNGELKISPIGDGKSIAILK